MLLCVKGRRSVRNLSTVVSAPVRVFPFKTRRQNALSWNAKEEDNVTQNISTTTVVVSYHTVVVINVVTTQQYRA